MPAPVTRPSNWEPVGFSAGYSRHRADFYVAMALLAGRREIAEIAGFATTLSQKQRHLLGLPRKKGSQAFYQVPTYSVFYVLLTRLEAEAFAAHVHAWLQTQAGQLPQALALDGKLIREHIGLLTLAQHDDGAPQAVASCDQKEGHSALRTKGRHRAAGGLPHLG